MYFTNKNMSIYYQKYGNKEKSILILPGWGDTRNTFINMINYFQNDYSIYILDYPGFGNSKFPKKDLTIYDYAEIIKDFIRKFKITNPIIIAHSFGGRIATLLSSYYKISIDKMVLIDIAGIKPKKTLGRFLKEKLYKILKKIVSFSRNRERYLKKLLKIFGSTDYQSLSKGMHQTFKNIVNEDLTSYFKYISCECLLLWGELDTSTPLKNAKKINKLIKESALIIYPKGNHFPYLQYPELTNRIIYEFLKDS